jgi:adhesin/invasin
VSLNPASIAADGSSPSTATATVSDANGNLVPNDSLAFTSNDPRQGVSGTTVNGNGSYSATVTSSTTVGSPTITATDSSVSPNVTGTATLQQTAGPATSVTVVMNPTSILANGTSQSTGTATVKDAQGHLLPSETVSFSSNAGNRISSPVVNHSNGTYSVTVTSTATAGTPTITATDGSVKGTATLTQTAGGPAHVLVALNPPSIPDNGTSTSTATAAVTDVNGNRISRQTVNFTANGVPAGSATTDAFGNASVTITSTTTPGRVTIQATDTSVTPNISGQAALGQTSGSSTTTLTTAPTSPVTNQTVTMIATVTPTAGSPAGAITFENAGSPISGCGIVSVPPGASGVAVTVTCQTFFAASNPPPQLTAVFSPSATSSVSGSTSGPVALTVSPDPTSTALAISNANPTVGTKVTYTTTVRPADLGFAIPSGAVQFLDGTKVIGSCAAQPLAASGSTASATCAISYGAAGGHTISARYLGDANFGGSTSPSGDVTVQKKPVNRPSRLGSSMEWMFFFTPTYTKVLQLMVDSVPPGATVLITCHGHGCPYAKHAIAQIKHTICKTVKSKGKSKRKCVIQVPSSTVHLQPGFKNRKLRVGTTIIVEIVRPGWIGKHYVFTIRARQGPSIHHTCLAPGSHRPGVGC